MHWDSYCYKFVHWRVRAIVMIFRLMIYWIRLLWRGFRRFRGGIVARLLGLLPICWIMIMRRGWCLRICLFGSIGRSMKGKGMAMWRQRPVFPRTKLNWIMLKWLNLGWFNSLRNPQKLTLKGLWNRYKVVKLHKSFNKNPDSETLNKESAKFVIKS